MSDIDALRQRVEAAEQSFGLIDERDRNYSARLISLISGIEGQLRQHQAVVAERDAQLGRLERENGELRAMLHSLLLAVEDGGKDRLGDTVNSMDQRVAALLASEQAQAEPAIDVAASAAPGEPAAADDGAVPDTATTTPVEVTAESEDTTSVPDEMTAEPGDAVGAPDETSTAPDAVAHDTAEPTPEPAPEDSPATLSEATVEPEMTAEAASAGAADEDAVAAPPERASADSAEVSAAKPAAEDAGDLVAEDAGDESLGEELLATLEDVIDDAPAEAAGSDAADSGAPGPDDAEDPIELNIEAEGAPDQEEATEAVVEAPADDTAALDEILSGAPTTDHTTDLEAEQPTIGALEGTDVVMVGWDADDAPDAPADATADTADPELAERAEKIAALLSSGDETDPSVKEIIEKVTELAASLSSESEVSAGDVDPTAETLVGAITAPDPAAEEVPQATSAA